MATPAAPATSTATQIAMIHRRRSRIRTSSRKSTVRFAGPAGCGANETLSIDVFAGSYSKAGCSIDSDLLFVEAEIWEVAVPAGETIPERKRGDVAHQVCELRVSGIEIVEPVLTFEGFLLVCPCGGQHEVAAELIVEA